VEFFFKYLYQYYSGDPNLCNPWDRETLPKDMNVVFLNYDVFWDNVQVKYRIQDVYSAAKALISL